MATIEVEQRHALGADEALVRARALVEEFASRLSAEVRWDGPAATFKGAGFSGDARVTDELVRVSVALSLLLRPMKSKIASRLERAMKERFS